MIKTTVTPVNASGSADGAAVVTADDYDAQGRLLKEVDNSGGSDSTANQTTSNVYAFTGTFNVTTTTNPNGSTNVVKMYLDGSDASDGGNDETPDAGSEGVVASNTTDANGNIETAGSTWTMSSSDGGQDWTKTFTNDLGEVYLVQQSDPSSSASPGQNDVYSDAITKFNLNGEAYEQIGTDGTASFTIYDPTTGQPGATWTDVAGTGVFVSGIDPKTITHESLGGGDNSDQLSTDGSQDDDSDSWDGGLDSSDTEDGMTTTTVESLPTGPGDYTVTTTNPDQTQTVDTYTDDLLTQEQTLGTTGSAITTTRYTYNAMRELATETDSTGTTDYSYYQDGTQDSETDPGQSPTTDDTPDPQANQSETTTLPDGNTQTDVYDDQGNLISQSGDGQLAATYGYDETGTGEMTSLTTSSGTTKWAYDPDTGSLQSETFADGTKDTYSYNDRGELASENLPGVTGIFSYDEAGDQIRSTYYDSATGLVQSTVNQQDDQGRALVTTDTDNGQTYTETDAYTSLGDLQSETFGSAGNASVNYAYYPTSGFGSTGSPNALQSMTVTAPSGSTQQAYAYDPVSKRLQTISVNGIDITYTYLSNSDQIASITAGDVTTTFTPDSTDGSLVGGIDVAAGGQSIYDASYLYNSSGQRSSDVIDSTELDGDGNPVSVTNSQTYTYSPSEDDSLTQVTDNNGLLTTVDNYSYDASGNRTGSNYGTVNSVNEYSNITYNKRGDETDDGTEHFTWDAKDELIGEAPDSPVQGSTEEQMGYDSQGRMLWQTVDTYDASTSSYVFTYTHEFVWSGQDLVAILDANHTLIENLTWGPGIAGSDTLLAVTDDTLSTPKTEIVIADASGNVEELVNPLTGTVDASYSYGPFGENFTASGPEAALCPFGFQMMMRDPSGKWYDHARWYDADLGRFISEDPTGINGGLNLDAFAKNDPINNSDSTGLDPSPAGMPTAQPAPATTGPNSRPAVIGHNKYGTFFAPQFTPAGNSGVTAVLGFEPSANCNCTEYAAVQIVRQTYIGGPRSGEHFDLPYYHDILTPEGWHVDIELPTEIDISNRTEGGYPYGWFGVDFVDPRNNKIHWLDQGKWQVRWDGS